MAKKTKKYADGGDIYEGTPLARAMGVRGVPEPGLEAMYPEQYMGGVGSIKGVGGSALKAVTPKGVSKKVAQETAEASTRAIAKQAERKALQEAKESAAKEAAEASAKQAQNKAFNRANMGDKLQNYSQEEKAAMGNKVNKFEMQEPGVSYRPLDHKDVMRKMGEFKKGGAVKKMAKGGSVSSASKRADGCAIRGKTRA
jgi:hypothetical protein